MGWLVLFLWGAWGPWRGVVSLDFLEFLVPLESQVSLDSLEFLVSLEPLEIPGQLHSSTMTTPQMMSSVLPMA